MNDSTQRTILLALAVVTAAAGAAHGQEPGRKGPERWEPRIAAFEKRDAEDPPAKHGIVFVGSSSIRGWKLNKYFGDVSPLPINRGFGGSQIADSTHFADRLITKHRPHTVVLYAGDNDIAQGKSPERVAADYRPFVGRLRESLPLVKIVFVAIKPSIRRWKLVAAMRDANQRIRQAMQGDPDQVFVDVDAPMIGADGRPRKELFVEDGLHLSDAGYRLWTSLVRRHLADPNWPEFRGPRHNGHTISTNLPLRWSEGHPAIRWKTALHGRGWSSPVIWGRQIWMGTATEDGKQMFAVCVDRDTGKIIHDVKLFENEKPRFCHAMNSYASPTPVVEAGRVYMHFGSYGTACLDSATGQVLWQRRDLPCDHFRGPGSSPLLRRPTPC